MRSETALLTRLLESEHAAVYGYGVLGGRLPDRTRPVAVGAFDAHRASRDTLISLLRARRADVPGPKPSYDVVVATPAQALALAVRLEEGMAVAWRDLVGGTDDAALRRTGVQGLQDCAVRATGWRRVAGGQPATVALPGAG